MSLNGICIAGSIAEETKIMTGNLDAAVQLLEKLNTSSPKNIEILKVR